MLGLVLKAGVSQLVFTELLKIDAAFLYSPHVLGLELDENVDTNDTRIE